MKISTKKFVISLLIALLLAGCNPSNNYQYTQLLVYPETKEMTDLKFVDQNNNEFNEKRFNDHWNLVFMGFTSCPDICPTLLTDVANIYKQLKPETQKKVQVVFLSVDPKRDTTEHLNKYLNYFHPEFIGITGEKANIDLQRHAIFTSEAMQNTDKSSLIKELEILVQSS